MATLLKYFKPKVGAKRAASNIVPTSPAGVKPVKKKVKTPTKAASALSPEVRQIIEETKWYM